MLSQLLQLDDDDLKAIDGIHKKDGKHKSLLSYHDDDGSAFGWTYEQMGWELLKGNKAKPE